MKITSWPPEHIGLLQTQVDNVMKSSTKRARKQAFNNLTAIFRRLKLISEARVIFMGATVGGAGDILFTIVQENNS